jgi:stage III sporulation protein AB
VQLFASLLQKQRKEAEEKKEKLSKLYNSLGVLFGIFICIFFL